MGKKYKNLLEKIAHKENLYSAANKAKKGNSKSVGCLMFFDHLDANIDLIRKLILTKKYEVGEPRIFNIYEPKKRVITALPFEDRVVQHAINNIIEPIFLKTFYAQSYGCIKNKGSHSGAIKCQSEMRKTNNCWILKTDFSGYFYNVDRSILYKRIRAKISCKDTIELIEKFVPSTGTGIPIGNLTSQLFANIYGTIIDEWLVHEAKITKFIRYMDDIVIISDNKQNLLLLQSRMECFCNNEMKLKFSHWSVTPASRGVNFLGYRIWKTHKLLRKQSVNTAKRKIRLFKKHGQVEKLQRFLASWLGYVKWADGNNLIHYIERLV